MTTTRAITADRPDGRTMDDAELRGYGITEADAGRCAVVQLGYAVLGLGATPDAALTDAAATVGARVDTAEAGDIVDGSVIVVRVRMDDAREA